MAKKRKAAKKTKAKAPAKPAGKPRVKPAATSSAAAGDKSKLSPEDTLTAIMTAVAIAIVLGALYLYQQNAKPKTSLLDAPQVMMVVPA